jgi:hypothetical protein
MADGRPPLGVDRRTGPFIVEFISLSCSYFCSDPIHGVGLCGILRLAALRGLPSGELGFGRRSGPILSCPQRRDVASSVVRVPVGQSPSTRATSGGIVLGLVGGRPPSRVGVSFLSCWLLCCLGPHSLFRWWAYVTSWCVDIVGNGRRTGHSILSPLGVINRKLSCLPHAVLSAPIAFILLEEECVFGPIMSLQGRQRPVKNFSKNKKK